MRKHIREQKNPRGQRSGFGFFLFFLIMLGAVIFITDGVSVTREGYGPIVVIQPLAQPLSSEQTHRCLLLAENKAYFNMVEWFCSRDQIHFGQHMAFAYRLPLLGLPFGQRPYVTEIEAF